MQLNHVKMHHCLANFNLSLQLKVVILNFLDNESSLKRAS